MFDSELLKENFNENVLSIFLTSIFPVRQSFFFWAIFLLDLIFKL